VRSPRGCCSDGKALVQPREPAESTCRLPSFVSQQGALPSGVRRLRHYQHLLRRSTPTAPMPGHRHAPCCFPARYPAAVGILSCSPVSRGHGPDFAPTPGTPHRRPSQQARRRAYCGIAWGRRRIQNGRLISSTPRQLAVAARSHLPRLQPLSNFVMRGKFPRIVRRGERQISISDTIVN